MNCHSSARGKRLVQTRIKERILHRFKEESDIEFAYSTWRVYNHEQDKKDSKDEHFTVTED
ncbi:hypothetical protein [Selenihalanaerobacter shriftii]|uniref:Uncharacterized protein n=1 Tax=Selenihalanaerobacter shriftii TaxID=142842 RepID=A0A1T4Q0Q4_9FIRM|nr:hypothetical protein [Selenihalanaerobacter shriftii]SJZ97375.1 hypothetical protein SAMN02745118_02387 [Selenihalanaerobacter shriftii]